MTKTLLEMSEDYKDSDPKKSEVLKLFAQNSDLLRAFIFQDMPGSSFSYNIENAAYEGINNPQTEHLRIVGGCLDVDAKIVKAKGENERDVHEMFKIKALACGLSGYIINGDSDVDIRQFDGIKKRIVGEQLVGINQDIPYSNGPLSISSLKKAIKKVDNPTHLIMSKSSRTRLSAAMRTHPDEIGSDISWSKDAFGGMVMCYKKLPILIADIDDTGSRIIDFNEAGPAGGTQCTSVYVVSISPDKLVGLQNDVMSVEDLGLLDSSNEYNNIENDVYRTRIEWLMCIAMLHGKAASRIWGITNAPVLV